MTGLGPGGTKARPRRGGRTHRRRAPRLQVLRPAERPQHRQSEQEHPEHDRGVAERPAEFGHVVGAVGEVHPVDAGDERQRQEDGRDDGQGFHHLVAGLREGVEVDVAGARDQVAVRLDEVDDPDEVVVDVPEVLLRLGFDLLRVPAGQHRQRLPGRPRQFPERQQVPADGGYLLEDVAVGRVQHLLDGLDVVLGAVQE